VNPRLPSAIEAARQVQAARFAKLNKPNVLVNGDMGPAEVQSFCDLDEAAPKKGTRT
jgi:hypothetical protein